MVPFLMVINTHMDIKTLESFKLSDAIKFHDKLNPKLWHGQKLRPEVKKQLFTIAEDFMAELGISGLKVDDITVSGSNAAYTYTPFSDLDLHILVDMSKLPNDEVYKELFNAKKTLYNDSHNITVHGVPVELYVQDSAQPVVSLGEYSLMNDKWLRIPTKRRANFDQTVTKEKYNKLVKLINLALRTKKLDKIQEILKTLKRYRQAGLDKGGEFSPENLAFKAVRSKGLITKLYKLRDDLHSKELSIENMYANTKPNNDQELEERFAKEFEDYHPNSKPRGPEFPPTMPAGTARVDVSDVYDWYKLGQHISDLKGLGKHDFGKGPPSTIISFGDEDTEHKYIKDLEKTGLSTTDIDPKAHDKKKGQKVDPTYNVNEKINPSVVEKDFKAEKTIDIKDIGPIKLQAYNISTDHPQQFKVDVINPAGDKIGYFRFIVLDYIPEPKYKVFSMFKKKNDPYVVAGNVSVWADYQKKGIATEVYKWIKSMGNDIKPSSTQTAAGKAMWRGFEKEKTVEEGASGYIPSNKQKNDPRFKTALTVDVKPDSIKKNAKAFGFNVSRAGIPPLLRK